MSVKSFDLDKVGTLMDLLAGGGVNNSHLRVAIKDPIRRAAIAAAFRGDLGMENASIDDILCREKNITGLICEWAGMKFPGPDVIGQAFRQAEKMWNGLTIHDRFIPGGMNLIQVYRVLYGFNRFCVKERSSRGFRLLGSEEPWKNEAGEEWWRTDEKVEHLPTETQIVRLDFREAMRYTDMLGSPFGLTPNDQEKWAEPDCIMSAEELCFLQVRSGLEYGSPLWGDGLARCRNSCGPEHMLSVKYEARDSCFSRGMQICCCSRNACSGIGVIRRKAVLL